MVNEDTVMNLFLHFSQENSCKYDISDAPL